MAERLTAESIRYAMNQLEKGKKVSVVAAELKVTPRHILEAAGRVQGEGSVHVLYLPGRPALQPPSREEVQMVPDAHQLEKVGVLRTMTSLRRAGHNTSYWRVYRLMKGERAGRIFRCKVAKTQAGTIRAKNTTTPCGTPTGIS